MGHQQSDRLFPPTHSNIALVILIRDGEKRGIGVQIPQYFHWEQQCSVVFLVRKCFQLRLKSQLI
jgi:hypothetical protein